MEPFIRFLFQAGNRIGPMACTAHYLGTQTRPKCLLNSLVKWDHQFCSADGRKLGLCSTGCEASFVLRLGFPIGQVEGCIQWWTGLVSLPHHRRKSSSKTNKALCFLNSNRPASQVPWLNRPISFVLQTISWSIIYLFIFYKPSIFQQEFRWLTRDFICENVWWKLIKSIKWLEVSKILE